MAQLVVCTSTLAWKVCLFLHHPSAAQPCGAQVLNSISKHMDIASAAPPFTDGLLASYGVTPLEETVRADSALQLLAVNLLRHRYKEQMLDLSTLIRAAFPAADLISMEEDVTARARLPVRSSVERVAANRLKLVERGAGGTGHGRR